MNLNHDYRPGRYFGLTFAVTWACWIPAAYMSWTGGSDAAMGGLMGLGLLGPLAVSAQLLAAPGKPVALRGWGLSHIEVCPRGATGQGPHAWNRRSV